MVKTIPVFLSLMLWSFGAWANLPTEDATIVSQYAAHLNTYYSDLGLVPNTSAEPPRVLEQLKALEDYLHGDRTLENGSLTLLACDRCVCIGCGGQ